MWRPPSTDSLLSHETSARSLALRDGRMSSENHAQNNTSTEIYESCVNPASLRDLGENLKILPVPSVTDDLETTARKLRALAKVVKDGNSLALWTGLKVASQQPRDPESIARSQMTPLEREQYEAWLGARDNRGAREDNCNTTIDDDKNDNHNAGVVLPDFNWNENMTPVPQGAESKKKFAQRAAAMDIIWDHQGATPENASWLTFHMPFILPLVKAVVRISKAKKHLQNNSSNGSNARGLTDMEVAEVETVRKIVDIAERNRTRELERIRKLTRSITESAAIIKSRAQIY